MTGKTCFDFLIWRVFCSQASLYGNHGHIWGKIGVCCSFEKKARDSSLAGTTTGLYGLLKMLTWQSGGWWFSVLCCTSRVLGYSFLFVCPELSYLCLLLFPVTRWACDVNWVWSEVVNDNLIHKYQVHFSRLVADFFLLLRGVDETHKPYWNSCLRLHFGFQFDSTVQRSWDQLTTLCSSGPEKHH